MPELTILTFSTEGTYSIILSAISVSMVVHAPNVDPEWAALLIDSIISLLQCPKINGPQDEIQSMYSLLSMSIILLPIPFLKNIGLPSTLLNALTGEFTPPGIFSFATLNAFLLFLYIFIFEIFCYFNSMIGYY